MKKYLVVSTFHVAGDGYTNYIIPICEELTKRGDLVIGYGLSYNGQPHPWSFGVSFAPMDKATSIIASLVNNIDIDEVIVALDAPSQIQYLRDLQQSPKKVPYTGIFAVEADPLSSTWAMNLMAMDKAFTISQFGADECVKAGVDATHLPAVIDTKTFKFKTLEEKNTLKANLGFEGKTLFFVNADGNERKNTALIFETLGEIRKQRDDFHLILLTRVKSPVQWDLNDLINRFNLTGFVTIMDRGLSLSEVATLYRASDFVLNVTKAEGLGMAILESQASGTPVIATNVTGMIENLSDGKGIAVEPDFKIIDIFGNGHRYFVSVEHLKKVLLENMDRMKDDPNSYNEMTEKALQNILSRTVEKTVDILKGVNNE